MRKVGWHFVGAALRGGRPVPADGEVLRHDGPLSMCNSGLHLSTRTIDALKYAPGSTVCRVRWGGEYQRGGDKIVCRERTILWRVDGEAVLSEFGRRVMSGGYKWDAAGEDCWAAASDAAWDAAWAAAGAAAGAAARAAAGAAAWDAAGADMVVWLRDIIEIHEVQP